jgi:hypothetical protein
MKFTIQDRGSIPPEMSAAQNDFPELVWPKIYRDHFDESDNPMQCLSLIRRQKGNVIAMKLVLRTYEAE